MTSLLLFALAGTAFVYLVALGLGRLRFLLLATLFLLPFLPAWQGIQLAPNAPLLNPSKLLLIAVVLAWALRSSVAPRVRHLASKRWRTALLVLASLQAASLFVAGPGGVALVSLAAYVGYFYLIYLCAYDVIDSVQKARQLMMTLAVAGTLVSIVAIWESITGTNLWHGANWYAVSGPTRSDIVRYGFARASGAFGNYLSLGTFLGMVWPLWLMLIGERARSRQVWGLALAALGFVATWATVSRGPIIGSLAAVLLWGTLMATLRGRLRLMAIVIAAGALLLLTVPGLAHQIGGYAHTAVVDTASPTKDPNAYDRLNTMAHDMGLIASHPLLGYGIGQASRTYATGGTLLIGVRSEFVSVALEAGVLAAVLFCYFFLSTLLALVRRALKCSQPQLRAMYLALSLSVTSVIVTLISINIVESLTYLFALIATGHRLLELESETAAAVPCETGERRGDDDL